MTSETDSWAGPYSVAPLRALAPAAPHVQHADEWVGEALSAVVAAHDVAWASEAATTFRASLADGADALRAVRSRLDEALPLALKHDAAVELARHTTSRAALTALFSVPTPASLDHGW